jgi:hypothetical protein
MQEKRNAENPIFFYTNGPILGPIVPTTSTLIENFLDKEAKRSST